MMVLLVIITILSCGVVGAASLGPTHGAPLGLAGFFLGAFVGLVVSATVASFFFLVLEIAENTRRVLRYYEPESVRY
jgi:hypothetical protein